MKEEGELVTNSEKEIEKGNEIAGEEIIQVTPSKEKEKEVNKLMFSLNKSHYYSTIMSFHQIRLRERTKYETVIHCSVPV